MRRKKNMKKLQERSKTLRNQFHNNKKKSEMFGSDGKRDNYTTFKRYTADKVDVNDDNESYERRWIIGQTIDPEGDIMASSGLQQVIEHIEMLKERPKLFPQKSKKKSLLSKKAQISQQEELIHLLGKDFKPDQKQLLKIKKEYEKNQKAISRLNDMSKPREKSRLKSDKITDKDLTTLEADNKAIAGLSKASQRLKNLKSRDSEDTPDIENPYIMPEDIEYEFENVYNDFLDDIKTKQLALETIKMKYKQQADKEQDYIDRIKKSQRKVRTDTEGKEIIRRSLNRGISNITGINLDAE